MCRLFAYISVNPILLDDVLRRPIHAITQQVQAQFQGEWFLNADGFGISWHTEARGNFNPFEVEETRTKIQTGPYTVNDGPLLPFVHGPHPAMYKTTIAKPLNDPTFLSLCANVSSKCIFAHLRAAGAPPVVSTNNHPFAFGRHCFMHNGYITNFPEIRKEMLNSVSQGFASMIEGGTDTEHLAALYMTNLCNPPDFQGADKSYTALEMWHALKAAIQTVEGIQTNRGLTPDNFLNICATDGDSLLSLCYRSTVSSSTPPFDLWLSLDVADTLDRKPYAREHGRIFTDKRTEEQIDTAARDLLKNARRAIKRGPNNEVIGVEPELKRILEKEEEGIKVDFPSIHGPHVVIASEPTTIDPGWFMLSNRDVIMAETVWKDNIRTLQISAETM